MGTFERKENILGTEIFVGRGVEGLKSTLSSLIEGGFVAVLYDNNLRSYAEDLSRAFSDKKHPVLSTCLVSEIPDHARFILGVGTGAVAYAVRRRATALGIDCALVFSAPTTDTILTKWKNLTSLKYVFLDGDLIDNCPKECLASGWGIILSQPLRAFEDYYNEKILDGKVKRELTPYLSPDASPLDLAYRLLQLSVDNRTDDNATVMAKVLYDSAKRQGVRTRLLGEYKFISASVIATMYESYLSSPSIDCAIPPSHDQNLDKLHKLTGRPMEKLLKAFDIFTADGYFRVGYILSEYRLDLLDKLKGVDFHSAQKRWRRIYPDAGYWLKSAFTTKSLLTAMKLSAEIGHGLLRYIAESGFQEAC